MIILRDHFLRILLPQLLLGLGAVVHLWHYAQWYWLWATVIFVFLSYVMGEGIFLHRYFTHKAFECPGWMAKTFAFLGMMGGFGSPIGYRLVHLTHHAHSEQRQDPHSPRKGFWSAFLGWYFRPISVSLQACKSLLADPYYRSLHEHHAKLWWATLMIMVLIDWRLAVFTMGLGGVIGCYVFLNFVSNYLAHSFGDRRFDTRDDSRNIWWMSWILLQGGGSLQNNHHAMPGRYHDSHRWYEIDLGRWIIPLLATTINHPIK